MGVSEICARKLTANKSIDLIFLAVATILFKPYLCTIVLHSATVPRSTTLVMIKGISLSQSNKLGSTSQNNLFDKFSSIRFYFNLLNLFNDLIKFNPFNLLNLFNYLNISTNSISTSYFPATSLGGIPLFKSIIIPNIFSRSSTLPSAFPSSN